MVLRRGSSSSSADERAGGRVVAEFRAEPRRFEQAITWARIGGGIAVLLIAPIIPILGIGYVIARMFTHAGRREPVQPPPATPPPADRVAA